MSYQIVEAHYYVSSGQEGASEEVYVNKTMFTGDLLVGLMRGIRIPEPEMIVGRFIANKDPLLGSIFVASRLLATQLSTAFTGSYDLEAQAGRGFPPAVSYIGEYEDSFETVRVDDTANLGLPPFAREVDKEAMQIVVSIEDSLKALLMVTLQRTMQIGLGNDPMMTPFKNVSIAVDAIDFLDNARDFNIQLTGGGNFATDMSVSAHATPHRS